MNLLEQGTSEAAMPPSMRLADRVGNGCINHPRDVEWVKAALRLLGRYNDTGRRNGYITRALIEAIRGYQRDSGLRVDGHLNPGGPTECTICVELRMLAGRQGA